MKKIEALLLGLVEYDKKTAPSDLIAALVVLVRDHSLLEHYSEKKCGHVNTIDEIKVTHVVNNLAVAFEILREIESGCRDPNKPTKNV